MYVFAYDILRFVSWTAANHTQQPINIVIGMPLLLQNIHLIAMKQKFLHTSLVPSGEK
jgi:hypothetical protein